MKQHLWKSILTWFCVLLYLVIGTINLDSSDIAEAKESHQVSLLDSMDEFVIDSVLEHLGLKSKEKNSLSTLLVTHGESEEEIGLSVEGVAPGNFKYICFQPIVLADVLFVSPSDQILVDHQKDISSRLPRAPPDIQGSSQLLSLQTVILIL